MHILVPLFFVVFIALPALAQEPSTIPASSDQIRLSFAPVVKKVSPAVVNIYAQKEVVSRARHPFLDDPFFAPFFGSPQFGGRMRRHVENSLGSGVIIQADGLVVTNAHVIESASDITVNLSDGREFDAEIALIDGPSDLALLRIDPGREALPFAPLRPSESLEVGDLVLAIGNPFGVGQTVTSGIVSALARSAMNINDFNFFIQTDAAINPGNSGGPLVSLDGGVIGINTAIFSRDGGSLGIGFAIPSEMVATVIAAEQGGRMGEEGVVRPWLGLSAQNVTSDIADSLGLDRVGGVLIADLHPASPLRGAGLTQGDVILEINGRVIRDAAEMKFRMATVPIGDNATFTVNRRGEVKTLNIPAIMPPDDPPRNLTELTGNMPLQGASVANLNPAVATELGVTDQQNRVVVYRLAPRSPASRLLTEGDVIVSLNETRVETVDDLTAIIRRGPIRGAWSIVLDRNGRRQQIVLR